MRSLKTLLLLSTWNLCYIAACHDLKVQKQLTPSIKSCEDAQPQGVGVGFDLTPSYGVAAISYLNGSIVTVAKVDGNPAYQELMGRLSLLSSEHISPPYTNYGDQQDDRSRQLVRRARKVVGLPASEDVGVLSTMLKSLKKSVEDYLGENICTATTTLVHLRALYEEDIVDAFDFSGLKYCRLPHQYDWHLLYETSSAYAGYGLGLCSNYTDRPACEHEQQDAAWEDVMAVSYTRSALTVTFSQLKSAHYLYEGHLEDFGLGSDARHQNPNEEYYWEMVRRLLLKMIVTNQYHPRPTRVLLLGESAQDPRFAQVLDAVLRSVMEDLPIVLRDEAENVAAMGVAEMAKRAPWPPDNWKRCSFSVI